MTKENIRPYTAMYHHVPTRTKNIRHFLAESLDDALDQAAEATGPMEDLVRVDPWTEYARKVVTPPRIEDLIHE